MYVVAGLPLAVHQRSIAGLRGRLKHAIIKGVPSPGLDGQLYSTRFVETLLRSVGDFAVRRRTNGNAQPTPASISLLYVPAPDEERLLSALDFAVMPVALEALATYGDRGRARRHDLDEVERALIAAVARGSNARATLAEVTRRLGYRSDDEGLLLPPRSFRLAEGTLTDTFRQFRRGGRRWNDRLADLGPTSLAHTDVPNRIAHQATRRVFVDARGLAFFIAHPTAYDGPPREIDDAYDVAGISSALHSLFRFGGALGPGMHHDVQRSDGSDLRGAVLECDAKGRIEAHGDYANIYPNDFVRVQRHVAVDEGR